MTTVKKYPGGGYYSRRRTAGMSRPVEHDGNLLMKGSRDFPPTNDYPIGRLRIVPWHGDSDGTEGGLIGGQKYRLSGLATTTGTCSQLTPNDGDAKVRLFTLNLGSNVTDKPFSVDFTMPAGYNGKAIPLYWQLRTADGTLGLSNLKLEV